MRRFARALEGAEVPDELAPLGILMPAVGAVAEFIASPNKHDDAVAVALDVDHVPQASGLLLEREERVPVRTAQACATSCGVDRVLLRVTHCRVPFFLGSPAAAMLESTSEG